MLPTHAEMLRAFSSRDPSYEGVFFTAVKTTGIFCRPTCAARKPLARNVEFFGSARDALAAGYRPCLRCRPLGRAGEAPAWLRPLLDELERAPGRRWSDMELRGRGLEPARVRRWFVAQHGLTFHAYVRARRLGRALGFLREGGDATEAAFEHGWESLSGFRDAFQKRFGATPGRSRDRATVTVRRLLGPLGPMVAAATDRGLCLLEFADRPLLPRELGALTGRGAPALGDHPLLDRLEAQLDQYFTGSRRAFDLPLDAGGTPFQREVWAALRLIPYGKTISYAELARRVGRPEARRAVGAATGRNPLSIVIPCHRVVGSDGALTGYGGGLWRKKLLLELERRPVSAGARARSR